MASVVVASIVTWERPMGEVVPKVEGVVVPLTALANLAKAAAVICCRGDKILKLESVDETSNCR